MENNRDLQIERALILSGGGGRGAYEAGVCQHLIKNKKWHPQLVLGNSIGSCNGALLITPKHAKSGADLLVKLWKKPNETEKRFTNDQMHAVSDEHWGWPWRGILSEVISFLQKVQVPPGPAPEKDQAPPDWAGLPMDELMQKLIDTLHKPPPGVEFEMPTVEKLLRYLMARPALMDRPGWQALLEEYVDTTALNDQGKLKAGKVPYLGVAAVEAWTGAPQIFWNAKPPHRDPGKEIEGIVPEKGLTVKHLMASSSIPAIYEATALPPDQRWWWDGFLNANAPIGPAIDAGAKEIIVVAMTPWHKDLKSAPDNKMQPNILHGLDLMFDWIFMSTLRAELKRLGRDQEVCIIAPKEPIGTLQVIDYDFADSNRLIQQGKEDAKRIIG